MATTEWCYRLPCDCCEKIVLARVPGYYNGNRLWCEECAPDCLRRAGYDSNSGADLIKADGCVFIIDEIAEKVPPKDPRVLDELRTVHAGRAYRVPYHRIEHLISRGFLNATGTKLTKRSLKII